MVSTHKFEKMQGREKSESEKTPISHLTEK